jgi:predicted transposase/invertase (TIGR01784 family)
VVFIAISDNVIFPDKVFYKSDHIILDKDTYSHDLRDFSFTFIELPKFKITDISLLTNIIEKWCYFFKHANKTSEQDLLKIVGSDQVIERAYTELNQFNWSEAELHTYDQEIKRIMDNRAAEDYKLEQAEAKGLEKGKAEGKNEEKIELARKMLLRGHSVEDISELTNLSIGEIRKLIH